MKKFSNEHKLLLGAHISHCLAHNCYLINLASPNDAVYRKSLDAMQDELDRGRRLRISALVIHPGSHKGAGEAEGIKKIASGINLLLENIKDSGVTILLETTAGQGTGIGYRFDHLAEIRIKDMTGEIFAFSGVL